MAYICGVIMLMLDSGGLTNTRDVKGKQTSTRSAYGCSFPELFSSLPAAVAVSSCPVRVLLAVAYNNGVKLSWLHLFLSA